MSTKKHFLTKMNKRKRETLDDPKTIGRELGGTTYHKLLAQKERVERAVKIDPEFPEALFRRSDTWIELDRGEKGMSISIQSFITAESDPYYNAQSMHGHTRLFYVDIELFSYPGMDFGFVRCFDQRGADIYINPLLEWFLVHFREHIKDFPAVKGSRTKKDKWIAKKKELKADRREWTTPFEWSKDIRRLTRKIKNYKD